MGQDEVTLGDKTVELSTFDRYKGRKGQKDCIAIISTSLVRAYPHWFNQKGFRCLSKDPLHPAICCQKMGAPTQKFGLVLFQYSTSPEQGKEGEILDLTKLQGKCRLWLISETRYEELSNLHKKWPLMDGGFDKPQHDIVVSCSEENYQRMTFTPNPDAHWKKKQGWYEALKAKEIKAREKLKLALGRALSEQEVMELLGASVPVSTGSTANAGDIDLSDILES